MKGETRKGPRPKLGTLLFHERTGCTAIITGEERDDKGYLWWWILDSGGYHYKEADSHLRNYLRRGAWKIVQEAEDEAR